MAVVVLVAMACRSDGVTSPIRHFEYSAATFSCGPADGPATAIYLAAEPVGSIEPATPFVRIYVTVAVDQLSGHVWQLSDGSAEGAAWFHSLDASSEIATSGYMIVSTVGNDKTVQGSVYLEFPDAGRVSGVFTATWIPGTIGCV
jgi:hypothetical protein